MTPAVWAEFALNLGGGRRLVLGGLSGGWLWLAAGLVASALLLVLYRYERQLVSRRAGLSLFSLRLAAALSLVAALFEPTAERIYTETVRGRVIVGVDLSESMATADPSRPTEEREKLRSTLGLGTDEPVESLTRRDIARHLLESDWFRKLQAEHDVELIGFARDAMTGLSARALADRLAHPPEPDDPSVLTTEWRPALEKGLEQGQGGAPVLGVVLVTDGLQNALGSRADDTSADRLAALGVPVYPILTGSTEPPPDAAIASVKAPGRVLKGDMADIEVTLKIDGEVPGSKVPVVLERPGAGPIRKTAACPSDDSRPSVTFRVPLEEVGTVPIHVSVGPVEGDLRPDNDRRSVKIDVVDDRAHVLLIDREARWEFRYLFNALKRDPHVSVEAVVFHQPPALGTTETTYPSSLPALPADGLDPLFGFDMIVIGDVDASDLTASFWPRLDHYTGSRGGTLVLSAGPRSWESWTADTTARKLMPVLAPRPLRPSPDPRHPSLPPGVPLVPAPEGSEAGPWPMLRFSAEAGRNRQIWETLPALPWVLGGRPKPLASVLVHAREEGVNSSDKPSAIVTMPYGLGRILWVGTDATWRWRYRKGDAYHHRFWGQAVRWAGSGKLAAGNSLVRFGPLRSRVPEGRPIPLRARFSEDADGITGDLLVAARVYKRKPSSEDAPPETDGDPEAVVPLRPSPDQPRVFEGSIPPLPPGLYVIKLEVPGRSDAPDSLAPLEVASEETSEIVELAASRDLLDRLAAPNNGRVLADYEASILPSLLSAQVKPRTRIEQTTLWDRPVALVLLFAILTAEWMLRKRVGLP